LLVVISIIAMLVALLLPALANARATGRSVICMGNVRSVAQALRQYAYDHEDRMPYNAGGSDTSDPRHEFTMPWFSRVGAVSGQKARSLATKAPGSPVQEDNRERIFRFGYLPFTYTKRTGADAFQCPEAINQVDMMLGGADPNVCHFSMNTRLISQQSHRDVLPYEVKWARLSDAEKVAVLVADGNLRWNGTDYHFLSGISYSSSALLHHSMPWPMQEIDKSQRATVPYKGHPVQAANVAFTDGHVETRTMLDAAEFELTY
jgi:prepilin-type processing-associated H-X9-DG protein